MPEARTQGLTRAGHLQGWRFRPGAAIRGERGQDDALSVGQSSSAPRFTSKQMHVGWKGWNLGMEGTASHQGEPQRSALTWRPRHPVLGLKRWRQVVRFWPDLRCQSVGRSCIWGSCVHRHSLTRLQGTVAPPAWTPTSPSVGWHSRLWAQPRELLEEFTGSNVCRPHPCMCVLSFIIDYENIFKIKNG